MTIQLIPASLTNIENSDPRMHAADFGGEMLNQIHSILFHPFFFNLFSVI